MCHHPGSFFLLGRRGFCRGTVPRSPIEGAWLCRGATFPLQTPVTIEKWNWWPLTALAPEGFVPGFQNHKEGDRVLGPVLELAPWQGEHSFPLPAVGSCRVLSSLALSTGSRPVLGVQRFTWEHSHAVQPPKLSGLGWQLGKGIPQQAKHSPA